jgi:O-antigen ligase
MPTLANLRRIDPLQWLAALGLLVFPAALPLIPENRLTGKAILFMLLVTLVAMLRGWRQWRSYVRRDDVGVLVGMMLLAAAFTTLGVTWPSSSAALYAPRIGVALLMLPMVRLLRPPLAAWIIGCGAGALGAAALSLWQVFVWHQPRADGIYATNMHGAFGLLLGVLPLLYAPPRWLGGWRRYLLVLFVAAGFVTIIASGSRAALLASMLVMGWRYALARLNWVVPALLCIVTLIGVSLVVPSQSGRQDVVTEVAQYKHGEAATSIGMRLDMWRAGARAWSTHPLAGIGPDNFHRWLVDGAEHRQWSSAVTIHDHAHNDLLHALATGGLLEALPLLIFFVLAWREFARRRYVNTDTQGAAGWGACALILATVLLGLTDTFFTKRYFVTFFFVYLMLMLGWSGGSADEEAAKG